MDWKKLGKALLFPHYLIRILLVPIATALLVTSMTLIGTKSPVAYISYVLAAYTLTVWCMKIPDIISFFKAFKSENKYIIRWKNDTRLRVNVSLYGALVWNVLFGIFQLWLGFYHSTFWYYSFGAYYVCLGLMRYFLVKYTSRYTQGEDIVTELKKFCACGWVLLVMNLALSLIIFFMVYWNRTFVHHMITTIAMAAYTFTSLTIAIINVIKYRKYQSPVFTASKIISLAAALVSMLTLESTMLTVFSDGKMSPLEIKLMLGATGGVISVLIVTGAIYMIVDGTKKLKNLKTEVKNGQ